MDFIYTRYIKMSKKEESRKPEVDEALQERLSEADSYLQRYSQTKDERDFEKGIKSYEKIALELEKKNPKMSQTVYMIAGKRLQELQSWDVAAEMYSRIKNPFLMAQLYYDAVTKTEGESQARYAEKAAEVLENLKESMVSISKKGRNKPSKLEEEVEEHPHHAGMAAAFGVMFLSILFMISSKITGAVIGNSESLGIWGITLFIISVVSLFFFNRQRKN